eukprot:NODE_183_length_13752_cov_1.079103.p3 type:complete len:332 gc:universal NODE_183_length_13752_cov_1.079103:3681-2686(-)
MIWIQLTMVFAMMVPSSEIQTFLDKGQVPPYLRIELHDLMIHLYNLHSKQSGNTLPSLCGLASDHSDAVEFLKKSFALYLQQGGSESDLLPNKLPIEGFEVESFGSHELKKRSKKRAIPLLIISLAALIAGGFFVEQYDHYMSTDFREALYDKNCPDATLRGDPAAYDSYIDSFNRFKCIGDIEEACSNKEFVFLIGSIFAFVSGAAGLVLSAMEFTRLIRHRERSNNPDTGDNTGSSPSDSNTKSNAQSNTNTNTNSGPSFFNSAADKSAQAYKILGLSQGASDSAIKKVYRKLAKEFHPDRNKDSGATNKFQEISNAYNLLEDLHKKNK